MEETASDISFFVRTIHFQGKRASYCLQNFNGPCPLLALANVLLLRAKLYIKPGVDRLKTSHLLTVIGDAMLEQGHDLDDETLSRLAGLIDGLQINVGFSSCTSFEPSTGLGVFEKLNIRVFHGWIPESPEAASALDGLYYNDAAEMVAVANEQEDRHDNLVNVDLLNRAELIRNFFASSPSQQTYDGLFQIHAAMREEELAVLFRNNHFTTIHKRGGVLYGLVTDVGYMHEPNGVWETIESLDGDTQLLGEAFSRVALQQPIVESDADLARRLQAQEDGNQQSDAALARRLQAQENGTQQPVGKLTSAGTTRDGREVLVDELGQRFVRKKPAVEGSSSSDSEESKCCIF